MELTGVDLARFEKVYDSLDKAHDRSHMERVRRLSVELAEIYAKDITKLAYIAATIHDIGLVEGKEGHEKRAADIARADAGLKEILSSSEIEQIAQAIEEHRASNGDPDSILAKIISDADRGSDDTRQAFKRAYEFRVSHFPDMNHQERLEKSAEHIFEKFSPGGHGRRVYFPETEKKMEETFRPLILAYKEKNWKYFASLL